MQRKGLLAAAAFAAGLVFAQAEAAVVRVTEAAFIAGSGLITFSEFALNTVNPTYAPATYGGGAGSPTVTFGGFFQGQSAGIANPGACPPGAAVSGCVLGNPTGPLTLDPNSPVTFITTDGSTPTSPVLSGTPLFNGAIAIHFSTPQVGVGLTGGFFNAIGGTAITAYDAAGMIIGQVTNEAIGIEFLGLVEATGLPTIAGLLFSLVGEEPFGYVIDNVRFGTTGQVVVDVPEPAALALFGLGLAAVATARRRRRAA